MRATVKDSKQTMRVIWFSRILRWVLGAGFITAGVVMWDKGGWPAVLFGAVIFITGFFRPRRCLEDQCEL